MTYLVDEFFERYKDVVKNFGKIQTSIPDSIVYISSEKFLNQAKRNRNIKAIITTNTIAKKYQIDDDFEYVLISKEPAKDFYIYYNKFLDKTLHYDKSSISNGAKIASSAQISKTGVVIEDGVIIYENVVVKSGVHIGKNVVIGPNSTIGYEGFEFMKIDGSYQPVRHNGRVFISENVEIQANSTVEKGIYGENTIICKNTKIDSNVLIGHNVRIGENVLIAGNVVVGGNTIIGDNVFIGIGASISNRIKVGNHAVINIGATVVSNIHNNMTVSGYFAREHNIFLREKITLMKLSTAKGKNGV